MSFCQHWLCNLLEGEIVVDAYSQENFDLYFALHHQFWEENPLTVDAAETATDADIDRMFSETRVNSFIDARAQFEAKASALAVVQKLRSEPLFITALQKLVRANGGALQSPSSKLAKELEALKSRSFKNGRERARAIGIVVRRLRPSNEWEYSFINYVAAYLYKDYQKDAPEMKDALGKIRKLITAVVELDSIGGQGHKLGRLLTDRQRARLTTEADRLSKQLSAKLPKNHSEKIFVKKMLILNKKHFREPRISAIADLMHLPFFKLQFDVRTLNRIHQDMQWQVE